MGQQIHQELLKRKCGEEAGKNNLSNPVTLHKKKPRGLGCESEQQKGDWFQRCGYFCAPFLFLGGCADSMSHNFTLQTMFFLLDWVQ